MTICLVAAERRFLLMPVSLFLVGVRRGQHSAFSSGRANNL